MKVIHLTSSLYHDEAERGIYPITHALMRAGHESIVISSADEDDELVARFHRDDTLYYRLPMPKKSWLSLRQVIPLATIIRQHRPDIIHVHSRTPAWILHWALKLTCHQPKIVVTIYGFYPLNHYARALFNADTIITASQSIDTYIKDKLNQKYDLHFSDKPLTPHEKHHEHRDMPFDFDIVCVRRGVDTRKYPYRHHASVHWLHSVFAQYPELEHKKWLLFPTPIGTDYGQEWLIDILGNLQDKFPDLHIIITEDNDPNLTDQDVTHEDFIQRTHTLELKDKITFIGRRPPDLRDWLASANIVLALASRPESIGITALQAIHLGTPVVGWGKGAFADILSALYPQGIVKTQTANALCKVIKSHLQTAQRPTMPHEYTIEQMVAQTLAVYQLLVTDTHLVNKDRHDNLICVVANE